MIAAFYLNTTDYVAASARPGRRATMNRRSRRIARRVYRRAADFNAVARWLYERVAKRAALIRCEIDVRAPVNTQTAKRQ